MSCHVFDVFQSVTNYFFSPGPTVRAYQQYLKQKISALHFLNSTIETTNYHKRQYCSLFQSQTKGNALIKVTNVTTKLLNHM